MFQSLLQVRGLRAWSVLRICATSSDIYCLRRVFKASACCLHVVCLAGCANVFVSSSQLACVSWVSHQHQNCRHSKDTFRHSPPKQPVLRFGVLQCQCSSIRVLIWGGYPQQFKCKPVVNNPSLHSDMGGGRGHRLSGLSHHACYLAYHHFILLLAGST